MWTGPSPTCGKTPKITNKKLMIQGLVLLSFTILLFAFHGFLHMQVSVGSPHRLVRDKYSSYKNRHDQLFIRDSQDSKYYQNKNHPKHDSWVKQQKQDNDKNKKNNQNNNSKKHDNGKKKK